MNLKKLQDRLMNVKVKKDPVKNKKGLYNQNISAMNYTHNVPSVNMQHILILNDSETF